MGFHLEAVGWERVVPSFGRPQELINQELMTADLTLVVFWNRVGVPSDANSGITGTQEEFELAVKRYGRVDPYAQSETNRPLLYVYFRDQTEPDTESAAKVRAFRKTVEEGKQLLYRQYSQESEWEELMMEHLVAFLNGRKRTDLERAVERIPPQGNVLFGWFYWQAIYEEGWFKIVPFDFDGDDSDEEVTFRFQQSQHWLTFEKQGIGYEVRQNGDFVDCLTSSRKIHLAIKDVNNDGVAELLIGAYRGDAFAMVGIYGMKDGRFTELAVLPGQKNIYVFENGHIVMPFGSVGLCFDYRWKDGVFEKRELHDPLMRLSAF